MRKLTKALAAVLLLAVVVSVFAVFGAFAATDATEVVDTYGTIIYDMDAQSSITVSTQGTNDNGTKVPTMTKGTEDGQTVWIYDYEDTLAGADPSTGNWFAISGLGRTGSDYTSPGKIIIRDDAGTTGTGTYDRAASAKNTDYLVIDFDVATDTEFVDDIYINTRLLGSGATTSLGNTTGSEYPAIGRAEDGRIYVSNGDGSNKRTAVVDSDDKWTHITIVYDFHPVVTTTTDETTGETTTTTTITNMAYAYINGYYVGTISSYDSRTAYVYFMRVQDNESATLSHDNASTKFANFTLKQFEAGYDGMMSEDGVLGSDIISLYSIPELKYCMYDAPGTPEGYTVPKIADIQRGDETIPVYDADDLHGDLLDGDVVTVYEDVASLKTAYAVKMVYDEASAADVAANVVWQDANGVALGAEGSLFSAPTVVDVPSDADWALITSGALTNSGVTSYITGTSSSDVIYDPIWNLMGSGVQEFVLFADYVAYGRSYGIEGSTSSSSTGNRISSCSVTFDLNGYTLDNDPVRTHWINAYSGSVDVIFKNGTVLHNGSGNNLVISSSSQANVILENCEVSIPTGTIFDHRGGRVLYVGCTVDSAVSLTNTKATGANRSYTVIDNCTITSTADSLVNLAQTNSSGVGRYGSGTMFLTYANSTVNTSGNIVGGDIYANATGHTDAANMANLVNHYVNVIGCDIETASTLTRSTVSTLPADGETVLTARYELDIYGSNIVADTIASIAPRSADTTKVDYAADIDVVDSAFVLGTAFIGQTVAGAVSIDVSDDCLFNTVKTTTGIEPTVTLETDSVFAYTSNYEGYNFITTSSYETYTYKLGNLEAETFYWNVPAEGTDEVNIDKVVTLAKNAGVYKYSWAQEGNAFTTVLDKDFALSAKSNLTLYDYFYFNLFVNKEQYDAVKDYVTVTDIGGNVLTAEEGTVTIDGVEYYKFQSTNLTPAEAADNAVTVTITVNGAYDDTYTGGGSFTVLQYAENTLNKSTSAESTALIQALLNYIVKDATLAGETATAEAAAALIEGVTFEEIDESEAKIEVLDGVDVTIAYGNCLKLGVRASAGDVIKVAYTIDGNPIEVTKTADENGEIFITAKACDFINDVTVTKDGESATVNIQGYYVALGGWGQTAAQEMVAAIYNYAKAAAAYKATLAE